MLTSETVQVSNTIIVWGYEAKVLFVLALVAMESKSTVRLHLSSEYAERVPPLLAQSHR